MSAIERDREREVDHRLGGRGGARLAIGGERLGEAAERHQAVAEIVVDEPAFVARELVGRERAAVLGEAAGQIAAGRAEKAEAEGEARIAVLAGGRERTGMLERASGGGELAGVEQRGAEAGGGLEAFRAEPLGLGKRRERAAGRVGSARKIARLVEEPDAAELVRVKDVVPNRRDRRDRLVRAGRKGGDEDREAGDERGRDPSTLHRAGAS